MYHSAVRTYGQDDPVAATSTVNTTGSLLSGGSEHASEVCFIRRYVMESIDKPVESGILYDEKSAIRCLGIDDKIHVAMPWSKTTTCGLIIKKKTLSSNDSIGKFSCYECTY